jgi:enoyl-CoA hydratase/carnithine racemase
LAVTAVKRAVALGMQMSHLDANRLEAALFASLVETHDLSEGLAAFLERRPASFESK